MLYRMCVVIVRRTLSHGGSPARRHRIGVRDMYTRCL